MLRKVALLTIHGMGDTPNDYHSGLYAALRTRLGSTLWERIAFKSIFYQHILQRQQVEVMDRMRDQVDWIKLREFLLYGFSDAASLEYAKDAPNSAYFQTQKCILDALDAVFLDAGSREVPVVIVAQSLGCQITSSYVWDAQKSTAPSAGIWSKPLNDGIAPGSAQDSFRRLRSFHHFCTTGCNIPIFVAGHEKIQAISRPNDSFTWRNFFDKDDALGWPLAPLSPSYWSLVTDEQVNANGTGLAAITRSWNPLSHGEYWKDKRVVQHLSDLLRSLVQ